MVESTKDDVMGVQDDVKHTSASHSVRYNTKPQFCSRLSRGCAVRGCRMIL